ncbi:hypothetical protein [Corynebacterium argentoratense]|uniref:hypothetical protein n=1 Tax=Corynebacterium argentoratense TaxID=42817 RepID=UPI001F177897|nr:hypothetical protein [Corynebacterium argentoratense]MCF1712994.1 hypothetical protein [Corynebacterium argentoratense]
MTAKKTETTKIEENDYTPEYVDLKVRLRGQDLTLKIIADFDDAPIEAIEHFQNDRELSGFKLLLDDQSQKVLSRMRTSLREFREVLLPAWSELQGSEGE